MPQNKPTPFRILRGVLPLIAIALSLALLGSLFFQEDVVISGSRSNSGYTTLPPCQATEVPRENTPLGIVEVYEPEIDFSSGNCTNLVFYAFNQYVTVTIDGEVVYRLTSAEKRLPVLATGGTWVIIPLNQTDEGKQLLVEITPVYEFVRGNRMEFLLGSCHSIFTGLFLQSLPELVISVLLIAMGLVVLLVAGVWRSIVPWSDVILPLGLSGAALALWRIADSRFVTFAAPCNTIFLYYVSLLSLAFTTLFLAQFLRRQFKQLLESLPPLRLLHNGLICVIPLTIIVQVVLQFLGIWDLRQSLLVTHLLLVLVIVLLLTTIVCALIAQRNDRSRRFAGAYVAILALGLGTDLLLYFVRRDSSSLLFTMLALTVLILVRAVQFLKHYINQEKTIAEAALQINQSRITLMLSQIRSHFIFNILNAISGMCKYDPERADRTVVAFARYLRTNINIMQDDHPVPFRAALEHVEDYVALEQIRFGDNIHFLTDLEVEDFMIPPLLMQPLVENAIRHGLLPRPEGGTIILRTRPEGRFIRVDVADDGVGFDPENSGTSQSVGMQNVRFRLEHMVGGHVTVTSAPGEGATVSLYIPREEIEA